MKKTAVLLITGLALLSLLTLAQAANLGTSLTYQGSLNGAAGPVSGLYDFTFQFYAYPAGGVANNPAITNTSVIVSNGLFTALVDFGGRPTSHNDSWLELAVRTNGAGAFETLTPRQPLTTTPFAWFADLASNVPPASITTASLASNSITATKIAPGQVVKTLNSLTDTVTISAGTNVNIHTGVANDLIISATPGTVVTNAGWGISGNTGTSPNVNFVGTLDGQPLEFRAGNQRALRLELNGTVPNVIGGSSENAAGAQVQGGTIGGGSGNTFPSFGVPTMQPTIGGGLNNTIESWAYYATISGGFGNRIQYDGDSTTIAGGNGNVVGTNADYSTIGGGQNNSIASAVNYGTIPGGSGNSVGATGGFAAGRNAHVTSGHTGTFIWNDGIGSVFSSGPNRFEVVASGGAAFQGGATFTVSAGSVPGVSASSTLGYGGVFSGQNGAYVSGTTLGLVAQSSTGYAGMFSGNVKVLAPYASAFDKPQLELSDNDDTGVARLRLSLGRGPLFWDIASRNDGSTNALRFYNSVAGIDVMTLRTDGTLSVKVLEITGGADVAEPFAISGREIPKGAVVIIDDENPGQLKLSERAYDSRVAGIVSGANGINPGLSLRQKGALEAGPNVALSGRVYVRADASNGAIRPGDLLTTAEVPGYAMKVMEPARAQGAILGKAMSELKEGRGLVLVLVTLQ